MIRLAANLSTLFREHPFEERFAAAAACGFQYVELQFPYDRPATHIRATLAAARLQLVLINAPAGDLPAGELGMALSANQAARSRDGILRSIEYAVATGCERVNVLLGRGEPGSAANNPVALENLREAADRFAPHGITILIEALNAWDFPGYCLATIDAAAELRRAIARPNVALQFDVYHVQRSTGDVISSLQRHFDTIGHVQIAGAPIRHEPNHGELAMDRILDRLEQLGYPGFVGCEYQPSAATVSGLGWARRYGISARDNFDQPLT
jgi:hydroxypyruvate isomerase